MAVKKAKKARKKSALLIKIGVFAFVIYGVISVATTQYQIAQKNQELSDTNARIEQQTQANEELSAMLNSDLDSIISKIAREKLGLVEPGVRVFKDVSGS